MIGIAGMICPVFLYNCCCDYGPTSLYLRHEDRRIYFTVVGGNPSSAGNGYGIGMLKVGLNCCREFLMLIIRCAVRRFCLQVTSFHFLFLRNGFYPLLATAFIFCFIALIQVFQYLFSLSSLRRTSQTEDTSQTHPVSVICCPR